MLSLMLDAVNPCFFASLRRFVVRFYKKKKKVKIIWINEINLPLGYQCQYFELGEEERKKEKKKKKESKHQSLICILHCEEQRGCSDPKVLHTGAVNVCVCLSVLDAPKRTSVC